MKIIWIKMTMNSHNYRTKILFYFINFLFAQLIWIFFLSEITEIFHLIFLVFILRIVLHHLLCLFLQKYFIFYIQGTFRVLKMKFFWIISKIDLREIFLSNVRGYSSVSKLLLFFVCLFVSFFYFYVTIH